MNNTNTLTADNIIIGGTELSLIYATKNEIGNNAQISTNSSDIAVLNTKQLQNFNDIIDINTNLTNNYQTNSQLSSNCYNKTEMDTTLTNYYTSAQIDTNLSSNYQNNTLLATNFHNKAEVDTLIAGAGGGGGYTDTQIDDKLNLKADLSSFTDNVSFSPIIDLSRPSILHQGLTLKNSTVNIEPLEGVLFSNQFGAEADRDVAVFRNQTSYIRLKGNKINCNATSNDSQETLELNNQGNGIVQIGTASTARVGIGASPNPLYLLAVAGTSSFDVIRSAIRLDLIGDMYVKGTGSDIVRPSATSDYTLRVRDNVGTFEFRNNKFGRTNGQRVLQDDGDCELFIGTEGTARVGVGTAPDADYFLNVGGTSNYNTARIANGLELENETANINNANGLTLYKDTTDASSVLTVKNAQGYIKFNSFNINAYNTSNDSSSLLLLNTADGNGCYCLSLGIGAIQGANKLNVSGGNSNFGGTATFQNTSTFDADINVNNSGRIFQRADANSSLNVISTNEINFSLQSNRADDPTTGSIALQLNDNPAGITMNRAVVHNQTFNSIGNITAEANLNVWGDLLFQHSSGIKETLNGSVYDLDIRNGDTDRAINLIVGAIGSTPEISVSEASVNLLGNLDITHSDVSGSNRVKFNNPDSDGIIFHSINGANIGEFSGTGLHINGALTETSDRRLKENVKEIDAKKCIELVKYIKPKTYNYIGRSQKCVGYIADDFKTKKMPEEWGNVVFEGKDDYIRMDYGKTTPLLWSALQRALNDTDDLKKEVKKLKGKGKGSKSDSN